MYMILYIVFNKYCKVNKIVYLLNNTIYILSKNCNEKRNYS